jgi:hypothetical protein
MARANQYFATLTVIALAGGVSFWPERSSHAVAQEEPANPKVVDPALNGSTITALLDANDGKVPATGKELWATFSKLGEFAQLPVVFSAVHLESGIGNPRVVITPQVTGLSEAGVTAPSLNGRLYLAANMEKDPNGRDPRVTSVEFISWNTLRRKFDFGVIENMGSADPPQLRVMDGGRCFACHKNKGPILAVSPWTNTTHLLTLRLVVADRLRLRNQAGLRDRIDGMALLSPQAQAVDNVVRLGAMLRLHRDTFRLMNHSDGGRKAFVAMLVAITQPGPIDPHDRQAKTVVDKWGADQSYLRFTNDWVALTKATNTGILRDFVPIPTNVWDDRPLKPLPEPPPGGFSKPADATKFRAQLGAAQWDNKKIETARAEKMTKLTQYDTARAGGKSGLPSVAQPSNPKAFIQPSLKAPQKPSGLVNPLSLAHALGLTEGDRKFMAEALADAAKRITKQKVTTATLAKDVFEGPEFADVLAGEPVPDRDEFKDRFVAGLDTLLKTRYKLADGFAPGRKEYASGPRRNPKAVEEVEAAIVPTTACLRCHDVRDGATPKLFEVIPALAFDPLDKQARTRWVQTANPKRKQEVLTRFLERLVTDADMPPQDSPEHDEFRVKQAASFDDLKQFLETELDLPKKR